MEGEVMAECWIYEAFHAASKDEAEDVLLYIGISDSPSDRMTQHARDKWWWHLVDRLAWSKLSSRESAKSVESGLIESRRPLFNKQENTATAGQTLMNCLRLVKDGFIHCPLCHSACKYSEVSWTPKSLCTVDIGEDDLAFCFEVWLSCGRNHAPLEWCQLIPVRVLSECRTKMPEKVLVELWHQADANGEVGDDIPDLRPPTLAEMFSVQHDCHANQTARLEVVS
ncbi:MAG: hypothetical protein EBR82_66635 [Caulobacteraceae bacterium]|nr:hypothetical protein [Caulobacteraceae bacterium]NBZ96438.1 hypothetical protein [Pseudomonadota bacterium]